MKTRLLAAALAVVLALPVAAMEAEFAARYREHMNDTVRLPGFVRIQRFQQAVKEGRVESPDPRDVAQCDSLVYEAISPGVVH